MDAMVPAVTEKEALLAPFGIATLPGVVRFALSSLKEMVAPPTEALFNDTVQEELCPPVKLPGGQERDESAAGAIKLMVAVRITEAALAVIIPVASAAIDPAAALNPTLDDPEGTVTLPGTVSRALLLERPTEKPPAGAEVVRVTVQERLPPDVRVPAPQERVFNAATGGGTVTGMLPPLPAAGRELTSEATTFVRWLLSVPEAPAAN